MPHPQRFRCGLPFMQTAGRNASIYYYIEALRYCISRVASRGLRHQSSLLAFLFGYNRSEMAGVHTLCSACLPAFVARLALALLIPAGAAGLGWRGAQVAYYGHMGIRGAPQLPASRDRHPGA